MTLRARLVAGMLALLLGLSVSMILVVRLIVADKLETELVKRGESIARSVATGVFSPILTEDMISLQQVLIETKGREQDLAYLFVLDPSGRLLGHSFAEGFPVSLREANEIDEGRGAGLARLSLAGEEVYDIAMPVAGGELGVVRTGFRAAVVKAGVETVMGLGAMVTVVMTLLASVAVLALEARIFRPVSRLTEAAREISGGRLEKRVEEKGDDEIGTLARAFNGMMDRIEKTRRELLELNEDLEGEVVERQAAEKRVREREIELKTIFESSPVFMAIVSRDGIITKVNQAWSTNRMEHAAAEGGSRVGSALGCLLALRNDGRCGEGSECETCLIKKTVKTAMERDIPLRQVEAVVPSRKGHNVHLLVSATPLVITGEKMVLVNIQDITPLKMTEIDLKKAFDELERQNKELRKIDDIKSALIRDVTHELKTPVAKFVMQLEMFEAALENTPQASIVRDGMKSMKANLVRQQAVIRNILNLSSLEKGERAYLKEPVRLNEMLEDLVAEYSLLLEGKQIAVEKCLAPVTVASDGDMLWHVFSNLISNAIKFTGAGGKGRIRLGVATEGSTAMVTVQDNGVGMSPELAETVFDPFVQSSASEEGIGVGLTLCRMIIEGLGGEVSLRSEGPGKGAMASVTLPVER